MKLFGACIALVIFSEVFSELILQLSKVKTHSGEGDTSEQKEIHCCDKQTWCFKHVGRCSAARYGRGGRLKKEIKKSFLNKVGKKNCLQAGDQSHRAVLGQVTTVMLRLNQYKRIIDCVSLESG